MWYVKWQVLDVVTSYNFEQPWANQSVGCYLCQPMRALIPRHTFILDHLSDAILTQQAARERRPSEFLQVPGHLRSPEHLQGSPTDAPETRFPCYHLSTLRQQRYCDWLDQEVNWFRPYQNHGFLLKMSPIVVPSLATPAGGVTRLGQGHPGPGASAPPPGHFAQLQHFNIINGFKIISSGSAAARLWG